MTAAECAPGCYAHSLGLSHGNDIAFKVADGGGPKALVDDELAEAVIAGVFVCFADDPGWGVGDAEIENLAGTDDVVEGLHEFGDGDGEIPPVHVEHINVRCLQLL